MVGGALGVLGHHALQHVGVVKEPENVFATTLHHQRVEVNNRLAALLIVQVRPP